MEKQYYYPEMDINGTADELFYQGRNYRDDFSPEALAKIAEILDGEGEKEKGDIIRYSRESVIDRSKGLRDIGQMKLDALDRIYTLYENHEGDWDILIAYDMGYVIVSISDSNKKEPESNGYTMELKEFLSKDAEYLDGLINELGVHMS